MKQNHPELIVQDLAIAYWQTVTEDNVRHVLKFRGVNKWLCIRRLLIQVKARWLVEIHAAEEAKRQARASKDYKRAAELKGYVKALTECRQQVRMLTHFTRDIDWPLDTHKWPEEATLPDTFPKQGGKRWLTNYWLAKRR